MMNWFVSAYGDRCDAAVRRSRNLNAFDGETRSMISAAAAIEGSISRWRAVSGRGESSICRLYKRVPGGYRFFTVAFECSDEVWRWRCLQTEGSLKSRSVVPRQFASERLALDNARNELDGDFWLANTIFRSIQLTVGCEVRALWEIVMLHYRMDDRK